MLPMRPLQQLLLLLLLLLLLSLVPKRRLESAVLLPESHATHGYHQKEKHTHMILHERLAQLTQSSQVTRKESQSCLNPLFSRLSRDFFEGVPQFLVDALNGTTHFSSPG